MKKILITGGNGYIAKSLYNALSSKYNITTISRDDFDLTNFNLLNNFFKNKYFDVIIHCAVVGGNRLKKDSYAETDANLKMYYNLLQHKDTHYSKLIHFGSGAEIHSPNTPYGISKKIISNSSLEIDNLYNIRIYAVFDENELDRRFIKANIKRYINKESIVIHQNKYMDFFYMKDLISLVEKYINNNDLPKEVECTYSKTYSLLNIANIINNLENYKVDIILENDKLGPSYNGKPNNLLNYTGLEESIKIVYNKLKNEH